MEKSQFTKIKITFWENIKGEARNKFEFERIKIDLKLSELR